MALQATERRVREADATVTNAATPEDRWNEVAGLDLANADLMILENSRNRSPATTAANIVERRQDGG
jgi:hypothetical protein